MFLGHFAVGFGAKRAAPELSLGTLFLSAQLADLVWPTLVLAGVEEVAIRPGVTAVVPLDFVSYPWSHSLLALAGWGVLLALALLAMRRSRIAAAVAFAAVVSHWLLDFASHRPDLPLLPHGAGRFGLELWRSLPWTLGVELALFALGVALYAGATRPRDRVGRWSLAALVGFLLAIYGANVFGPPPPAVPAIAWAGEAMWLLVVWGAWIDRHREVVPRLRPSGLRS